jgi:TatD DNase family protein
MEKWKYIDAHGHINSGAFDEDREALLALHEEEGVAQIIIGTDSKESAKAVLLADPRKGRWATVGQHPTDNHAEEFDMELYRSWLVKPEVVGIGECGLDYYWPESDGWPTGETVEKARQRELFSKHIQLARATGKPLVIHGRPTKGTMDAYHDIIEQLKSEGQGVVGDIHFFVGNTAVAKEFLDLGFSMSFTGVITFTHDYDEVVKYIPLDRIMAETDAPFVAPKPFRGKRNEPHHVREVYAKIAELKGIEPEEARIQIVTNCINLFKLT